MLFRFSTFLHSMYITWGLHNFKQGQVDQENSSQPAQKSSLSNEVSLAQMEENRKKRLDSFKAVTKFFYLESSFVF